MSSAACLTLCNWHPVLFSGTLPPLGTAVGARGEPSAIGQSWPVWAFPQQTENVRLYR